MPSLLFVCTANRFRSPLAVAFFNKELLLQSDAKEWKVESAGTWAIPSLQATTDAISEAQKRGCDLRFHKSRTINADMIKVFDLILVMEEGHKEALTNEFQDSTSKVFLLSEFAGNISYSIPDPYMTDESPSQIAEELEILIHRSFMSVYDWCRRIIHAGQANN